MAPASGYLAGFGVRITPRRRFFKVIFPDYDEVVRIDQKPALLPPRRATGSVRYIVGHDQLTNERLGDPRPETYAGLEPDADHGQPAWYIGTDNFAFTVPKGYAVEVTRPTRAEPWECALTAAPVRMRDSHRPETYGVSVEEAWPPEVDHLAWIHLDSLGREARSSHGGYMDEDGVLVHEVRRQAVRYGEPVELRRITARPSTQQGTSIAAVAEGLDQCASQLHDDVVALIRSLGAN